MLESARAWLRSSRSSRKSLAQAHNGSAPITVTTAGLHNETSREANLSQPSPGRKSSRNTKRSRHRAARKSSRQLTPLPPLHQWRARNRGLAHDAADEEEVDAVVVVAVAVRQTGAAARQREEPLNKDYGIPISLCVCRLSRHLGCARQYSIACRVFSSRSTPSIGWRKKCSNASASKSSGMASTCG